jgi:hypothetical protein
MIASATGIDHRSSGQWVILNHRHQGRYRETAAKEKTTHSVGAYLENLGARRGRATPNSTAAERYKLSSPHGRGVMTILR